MLENSKNIDQVFKDKLSDFGQAPPTLVWDNINEILIRKKRERLYTLFRLITAAAVIVVVFIAGWWFNTSSDSGEVSHAGLYHEIEPDIIIDNTGLNDRVETILNPDNLSLISEASTPDKAFSVNPKDSKESEGGSSYIFNSRKFFGNNPGQSIFNLNNGFDANNYDEAGFLSVIADMLSSFEEKIYRSGWNHEQSYQSSERDIKYRSFSNRESYNPNDDYIEREDINHWSFRAMVSPLIWGNTPTPENSSFTKAEATLSGGLLANYKLSNRFSVRGGVIYSKIKHNTEQVNVRVSNDVNSLMYSVTSPAGSIEFNSSGNNSGYDYLDGSENFSSWPPLLSYIPKSGEFLTESNLIQNMEYLEVPLVISYKLIDSNVDVEINGGVSSNFLVRNSADVYENGEKLYSAKTADLRNVIYAGSIGVGFEYDLNKNLALLFEPNIKYYLNSISNNQAVDYRPFNVGLFAGFTYFFN